MNCRKCLIKFNTFDMKPFLLYPCCDILCEKCSNDENSLINCPICSQTIISKTLSQDLINLIEKNKKIQLNNHMNHLNERFKVLTFEIQRKKELFQYEINKIQQEIEAKSKEVVSKVFSEKSILVNLAYTKADELDSNLNKALKDKEQNDTKLIHIKNCLEKSDLSTIHSDLKSLDVTLNSNQKLLDSFSFNQVLQSFAQKDNYIGIIHNLCESKQEKRSIEQEDNQISKKMKSESDGQIDSEEEKKILNFKDFMSLDPIQFYNIDENEKILNRHHLPVLALASWSDGILASGSGDRTVRFWDIKNEKMIKSFDNPNGINSLVFFPNGNLASSSFDKSIRIWNLEIGLLNTLNGHSDVVRSLLVLPDSNLVSGSDDMTIRIWNTVSGETLQILKGHYETITCLALVKNIYLVSGSPDETIRIWKIKSGETLDVLNGHRNRITCLETLFENDSFASGSRDWTIRIWNIKREKTILRKTLKGHEGYVLCIKALSWFLLASGSCDNTIRIWNIKIGNTLRILQGHNDSISCLSITEDGELVSGSFDYTIIIWDKEKTGCLKHDKNETNLTKTDENLFKKLTSTINCLTVLPDGSLATGTSDGSLQAFCPNNSRKVNTFYEDSNKKLSIRCMIVLSNGNLVSCSDDSDIKIWNIANGKLVSILSGHTSSIFSLAILPNGNLVSGSLDTKIKIWNLEQMIAIKTLNKHTKRITCLVVSRDGCLISSSADLTIRIYDQNYYDTLKVLKGHTKRITCLAVLKEEDTLASGSWDNDIIIWNIKDGGQIRILNGHTGMVFSLVLLVDGNLASGSYDKTIRIWDTATGITLKELEGHEDTVSSLAVSKDGTLFSGSYDNSIRIWKMI